MNTERPSKLLTNMLRRTFRRQTRVEEPGIAASVPEGLRLYVIGDIHGRINLLDRLHEIIDADYASRSSPVVHVIYLGDYVDRGPDSAAVLERLATGTRISSRSRCCGAIMRSYSSVS